MMMIYIENLGSGEDVSASYDSSPTYTRSAWAITWAGTAPVLASY